MTERARTVFLGTGAFAVPVLDALARHGAVDLVAVVTAPERQRARGKVTQPPVAVWAAEHGAPMLRPDRVRSPESLAALSALAPDLLILADYGQIVPSVLLDLPRHGALNVHPSLLPRWRGATPIPAAILHGDAETGVTVIRMDAGLDTGPIVAQWRVPIEAEETAPQLEERLAHVAADLLEETLPGWLAGDIEPHPQDHADARMTRPLRREDGRLDPTRIAAQLERQVRAYQPWPGSFIEPSAGRVVVWSAKVGAFPAEAEPGTLVRTPDGGIALGVVDGLLEFVNVQPAGGRRMSGAELLRGRPALAGSKVAVRADTGTGG